jgi:acyl-CoA synthetase (AMP-forming)/AMP-acid ligase II
MNITEPVWRNCAAWPARVAVVLDGRPMAYGAMRFVAERAAQRLGLAGLKHGDVVALGVQNPLAYLILVLAAVRLGATVTPFKAHWPFGLQRQLLAKHRVVCLDGRELLSGANAGDTNASLDTALGEGEEDWHLALSSATTGVFRSIAQSHARSVLAWTLTADTGFDNEERVLVAMDLATPMGLDVAMRALYAGATVVLTHDSGPNSFFAAVTRDRPARVVTSTANMGAVVAFAQETLPQSLSACASLRSVSVMGAVVPPALREAIVARICTQLEIPYGATETGWLATATPETLQVRPGSAGLIHAWVQAQVVDENNQPLPDGQAGILRFRTPFMARGYMGDPLATARSFRDGWCYTGDTGSVDGSGYLTLGGQTDHLLNLGGVKLDPRSIERVIEALPGVRASVALAVPSSAGVPMLVAVIVADGPVNAEAIKRVCRAHLGSSAAPSFIVAAPRLPRDHGGQVVRQGLVALVAAALGVSAGAGPGANTQQAEGGTLG